MRNVMSVDVEDYFHVEAFASHIRPDEWHSYLPRVDRNVGCILELFSKFEVRGTFFVLGWVAEQFPHLSRAIRAAGHEVGCHGYGHTPLQRMTAKQFQQDLRKATALLTDQIGQAVRCFRAPSFSIVRETLWAFNILSEEGYTFDSSIFPVRHDFYGMPDAQRFPHWTTSERGIGMFEFPLSTLCYRGVNIGVGGGGYLRLVPYGITYWALRRINLTEHQPAVVYFHPWEIDPDQPGLRAGIKSTLRHYTNLSTMEGKIERLLHDFKFGALSEVCREQANYSTKPVGLPDYAQPQVSRATAAEAAHA